MAINRTFAGAPIYKPGGSYQLTHKQKMYLRAYQPIDTTYDPKAKLLIFLARLLYL